MHALGHEDGLKEGVEGEKRKTAERLLEEGVSIAIIMKATGLNEAEIKGIQEGMPASR